MDASITMGEREAETYRESLRHATRETLRGLARVADHCGDVETFGILDHAVHELERLEQIDEREHRK